MMTTAAMTMSMTADIDVTVMIITSLLDNTESELTAAEIQNLKTWHFDFFFLVEILDLFQT